MPRRIDELQIRRLFQEIPEWPTREELEERDRSNSTITQIAHRAVRSYIDELSALMTNFDAAASTIEDDNQLSDEGKRIRLGELGRLTVEKKNRLKSFSTAENSVKSRIEVLSKRMSTFPKEADNPVAAMLQAEIRSHIASKPQAKRLEFALSVIDDPRASAALFGAPHWVTGLANEEFSLLKARAESKLHPDQTRERDELVKAIESCRNAMKRAETLILERVRRRSRQ